MAVVRRQNTKLADLADTATRGVRRVLSNAKWALFVARS